MNKKTFLLIVLVIFLLACQSIVIPTATFMPPTATFTPPGATPVPFTSTPRTRITPPTQAGADASASNCISSDPTQADIDRALSYTGQTFTAWERNYAVAESRVAVTWMDNEHGAMAYLEALIFPCGYEEPEMNAYFSDKNWETIFADYESYQPLTNCKTDAGLRLYQFKTRHQGLEYAVNYWVQSDTDTRVIVMMLVFPLAEQSLLESYSTQLFSDIPSCS